MGRYRSVDGNLGVKEVRVGTERFVVCHNPEQARRDEIVRERIITHLGERIAGSDNLSTNKRHELYGALCTKPGLRRFLRLTPDGKLRIDKASIRQEAHFGRKFLPRSSDERLSAEEIALGYKALYEAERGWRDLKSTIDLRPVFHRREDRIRGGMSSSAGWPFCCAASPRSAQTTLGGTCATSSSGYTSSPWRQTQGTVSTPTDQPCPRSA